MMRDGGSASPAFLPSLHPVIPGRGLLPANLESITTALRRMDSGFAACVAPRNDGINLQRAPNIDP